MTSGVYEILNTVNGKRYIGSAKKISARMYEHRRLLRCGTHHSVALQRAWIKYGEEAFAFREIASCEVNRLLLSEQECMDRLAPEYNMRPVAGSALGSKRSLEDRAAQSARLKGDPVVAAHCARMSAIAAAENLGKKRPPEWRMAISAGLKGKKHSPERCASNGDSHRGKKKPPSWGENLAAKLRGVSKSDEHRSKLAAHLRAYWLRRKAEAAS